MPLVKRCACCGRLAEPPKNAMPYRKGYACQECYKNWVLPARNRRRDLAIRKYKNANYE